MSGPFAAQGWRVETVDAGRLPVVSALLQGVARDLEERGLGLWSAESLSAEALLQSYALTELRLGWLDGEPVATMTLQEQDELFWPDASPGESLFVHKLAVADTHRGRGLATRMLDHACGEARQRGKAFLRLDTVARRRKLRDLYEAYGFGLVDEQTLAGFEVARYQLGLRKA